MSKPYNPNTQGWGFALVVCALTAGLAGTAYTIHKNTYVHPRNPMMTQAGAAADAAHESGEHAASGDHEESGDHAEAPAAGGGEH
jgi:hypothetical protein